MVTLKVILDLPAVFLKLSKVHSIKVTQNLAIQLEYNVHVTPYLQYVGLLLNVLQCGLRIYLDYILVNLAILFFNIFKANIYNMLISGYLDIDFARLGC